MVRSYLHGLASALYCGNVCIVIIEISIYSAYSVMHYLIGLYSFVSVFGEEYVGCLRLNVLLLCT